MNNADKFTVSDTNGNGLLTHPVAMLTGDEVMLAGKLWLTDNFSYYLYTNQAWWTISPSSFTSGYKAYATLVYTGSNANGSIDYPNGVRPSVSLAPSTKITSGDGSMEKPFEIK